MGSEALEYALAVQADRLDSPEGAMTDALLAANRDIVINEYRGYESRSFGFGSATDVKLLADGFGSQHPYGRPIQLNGDVARVTEADMRRMPATAYEELLPQTTTIDERSLNLAVDLLRRDALVFVLAGDAARLRLQLDAAGMASVPWPKR